MKIIFLIVITSLSASNVFTILPEERALLHRSCSAASVEDDTRMMSLGKESCIGVLVEPRTDCSGFSEDLVKAAKAAVLRRIDLTDEEILFSPWASLSANIFAKAREGRDLPLDDAFALAYIRNIPGWAHMYMRMQTEMTRRSVERLSLSGK